MYRNLGCPSIVNARSSFENASTQGGKEQDYRIIMKEIMCLHTKKSVVSVNSEGLFQLWFD